MGQNISDYQGGNNIDMIGADFPQLIKVYNDLGAAVTNGDVYFLDWVKDADSLSPSARPTLVAAATSAVQRQVVVVDNAPEGKTTIADAAFGWVRTRGYCSKIKCASTVAIDDYLQGTNATQEAADDGTTQTADSFAIATTAYASGFCEGILFGTTALIG